MSGHINNLCWSPCGSAILFTASEEPQIYCLRLSNSEENVQSSGAAVPIMDLSKASIISEDQEMISGTVRFSAMNRETVSTDSTKINRPYVLNELLTDDY